MSTKKFSPEEFNMFLNKRLDEDQIETFYRINLINPLKVELFRDFTLSLLDIVHATYPGDDIKSDSYFENHFNYCFNKTINNFAKEQLFFNGDDKDIREYFYLTLEETYYNDPNKNNIIDTLKEVYEKIFDMDNIDKTQSDMEIFIDIYRSFFKLFTNNKA